MKKLLFFFGTSSMFLFSFCSNPGQTNQQSYATTKEEVMRTMQKVIQFSEQVNFDSASVYFDSGPDFRSMEEGVVFTYDQFKRAAEADFSSIKKQVFQKKSEEVFVYRPDLANYLYTGSVDMVSKKDSTIHLNDYAGSFLLRKTGGVWKIIQMHQSASPSTPGPAVKK